MIRIGNVSRSEVIDVSYVVRRSLFVVAGLATIRRRFMNARHLQILATSTTRGREKGQVMLAMNELQLLAVRRVHGAK